MSDKNLKRRESVRDELLHKARDLFGLCDTEDKGFATKRDMRKLQGQLSLPLEQLDEVFDALDKDGNGYLTLDEFTDGFGMFLGIDTETWQNADQTGNQTNPLPSSAETETLDTEADDEQFEEFLDQLGAQNVFRDEDYIRQMWNQVKKHDPLMVNNFEDFLGKITFELKNSKREYCSLENTLKNRNSLHDRQVQLLYMEMEEQLQSEKEHLLSQERMKEKKVKDEMESELLLKDQQLQELLFKHAQMEKQLEDLNSEDAGTKHENVKLQKERDSLELRLEASERMLNDMQRHLDELRRRSLEERRKRAQAALKVSEGIALERENLVNQLQMLQKVNKQLLDEKDELMLSASNTPFCRSPENPCSIRSCEQGISDVRKGTQPACDEMNVADTYPSESREKQIPHLSCHSMNVCPETQAPLVNNGETVVTEMPGVAAQYAIEQQLSTEAQELNTSSAMTPGLLQTSCMSVLLHPLCQKDEEDCEVDDCFFENNPHFVDIPQESLVSLQNNLNLNTAKKINNLHKQSCAFDECSENTSEKSQKRRISTKSQGRKSPAPDKEYHTSVKKSISGSSNNSKDTEGEVRSPERVFKVVFAGDSGVGKTSFIHRFCRETFRPTFSATIGVDFQVKTLQVEDRLVALQLWDTAGQERFRSLTKQYFRKADGIVIVYDVTSETSFKNVRNWISHIKDGFDEEVVMMLIGNKLDLCENDNDRVVKSKDGSWLADEFECLFFETSAKTGSSVQEAMYGLSCLLQEKEDEVIEKVVQLQVTATKQKKKCC